MLVLKLRTIAAALVETGNGNDEATLSGLLLWVDTGIKSDSFAYSTHVSLENKDRKFVSMVEIFGRIDFGSRRASPVAPLIVRRVGDN